MDKQVNVYEAKSQLSKLLEEVEGGGEVTIARNGRPIARLVPLQREPRKRRQPGAWAGRVWIADDFDELDPEWAELFYNGPVAPEEDERL